MRAGPEETGPGIGGRVFSGGSPDPDRPAGWRAGRDWNRWLTEHVGPPEDGAPR